MAGSTYTTITLPDGDVIRLTDKRDEFARMVARGETLTDSYMANYSHQGDRRKARQPAQKLAKYPEVAKAIAYYKSQHKETLDISDEAILAEYANKAWGNLVEVLAYCNTRDDLKDLPSHKQRWLKKITFDWVLVVDSDAPIDKETKKRPMKSIEVIKTIEIHDPHRAQDRLAEINGMIGKNQGKGLSDSERAVNVNININGKTIKVV